MAVSRVGKAGTVIGLDILPMEPLAGVRFLQGDFTRSDVLALIEQQLAGKGVDLVLSDMAPNMSGVAAADQIRSVALAELALDFANRNLKPGGALVVKVFQGAGFDEFVRTMRGGFQRFNVRKPAASRPGSSEVYLVGRGKV